MTEAKIAEYFSASADALEVLKVPEDRKAVVKDFTDWLKARDK